MSECSDLCNEHVWHGVALLLLSLSAESCCLNLSAERLATPVLPAKVHRSQDAAPASVLALLVGCLSLAPVEYAAPASVVGFFAHAPVGSAAPAVVVENIAPAPAVYLRRSCARGQLPEAAANCL